MVLFLRREAGAGGGPEVEAPWVLEPLPAVAAPVVLAPKVGAEVVFVVVGAEGAEEDWVPAP